jgi:hypothetical protein
MNDTKTNQENKKPEQKNLLLSKQSEAFLNMLTKRGLLEDTRIDDEAVRKAVKEKNRRVYHNTKLMLKHYRDINWALECFPAQVDDELDRPLNDLDALLSLVNVEMCIGNVKIEDRLRSIQKSRLLLDRFNEALTFLRKKPGDGELMYKSIYLSYIAPENLTITEILYRIGISERHFYRIRKQAINMLSIRLWAAPTGELDAWLEILTLIEAI